MATDWVPFYQQVIVPTIFQNYQNTCYLSSIILILERWHCSLAVVTPAKYESDSKDLTGIAISDIPIVEINGCVLVAHPTPPSTSHSFDTDNNDNDINTVKPLIQVAPNK